MASHFNRPGFEMFDYDVYALAGDGCMMEGVSSEAASLAGHLKLANLCWVYDNNKITIEGHTEWAFSEDVATRFISYGWNVTRVGDANDLEMLERAFTTFRTTRDRPTLVIVDSHIAWGAPNKQDTHAAHGEPLGDEEIRLTKRNYGWPEDARFLVPDGVREHFAAGVGARGHAAREAWLAQFEAYRATDPEHASGPILNGLSLSKVRAYGSGFLIFSDYMRPAIRLSALMELPVVSVFTHDSIGVGEDGPTHQPIEQLASLRAIPGLLTIRPGDANEVVEAWRVIAELHHEPVVLVLTRGAVPTLDRQRYASAAGLAQGAY